MGGLYLDSRLDYLRQSQNADGGWGYFPGKQSWTEPTTYAMLALHGTPGSEDRLVKAWTLIRSWQTSDGSTRPSGQVHGGTWVTAHVVTLACIQGVYDDQIDRSIDWLLRVSGAEHNPAMQFASHFNLLRTKLDVSHEGWPWRKGNASWIEPTSHTLVALKKVSVEKGVAKYGGAELRHRVAEGEALLFGRRCSDGGWNCGNPNVLNYDLPSYPETTALALIGLQGRSPQELSGAIRVAARFRNETKSSLAKAWLEIALRCHSQQVPSPAESARTSDDVMLNAIEALGHPTGNYALLRPGGRA